MLSNSSNSIVAIAIKSGGNLSTLADHTPSNVGSCVNIGNETKLRNDTTNNK